MIEVKQARPDNGFKVHELGADQNDTPVSPEGVIPERRPVIVARVGFMLAGRVSQKVATNLKRAQISRV